MELCFKNRSEWRKWLEKNSGSSEGIWMKIFKKHTGIECVPYVEAVEEALCFGWIDGRIKRIDDEYYIQHYTRRSPSSRWSKYNIERVQKLIKEGRMTSSGLKAFDELKKKPHLAYENRKSGEPVIPDELLAGLKTNRQALDNFLKFPPSARRMYIEWYKYARQDKTRLARLEKIIFFSEQNKRPGML